MSSFFTKVAGVAIVPQRQVVLKGLAHSNAVNLPVVLTREPDNAYDKNAIAVWVLGEQIGYINRQLAAEMSAKIDSGKATYTAVISQITGAEYDTYGCNLQITVLEGQG